MALIPFCFPSAFLMACYFNDRMIKYSIVKSWIVAMLIVINISPLSAQTDSVKINTYNLGLNLAPLTSQAIEVLNDLFIHPSFLISINVGGNYGPGLSFYLKEDGVERFTNKAFFAKIIPTWYISTEHSWAKPINFRLGLGYAISTYNETGYNYFEDEFVEAKGATSALLAVLNADFKLYGRLGMRIGFQRAYSFRKDDHLGSFYKTHQSGLGALAFGRLNFQTMFGFYWCFRKA
jgi:hypothetical protein